MFVELNVVTGLDLYQKGVTWTSEAPITIRQLKKKRDAFWETAPSYEGYKVIWDALRHACESTDTEYAQLILNAAKITIPTGNLVDGCYDELGNRYAIPAYCLVDPTNLIRNEEENSDDDETIPVLLLEQSTTELLPVIIRLSNSAEDIRINVNPKIDTIDTLKLKLCVNQKIDPKKFIVRIFFLGSLLDGKTKLSDVKLDQGQILQALISEIP
ncbi:12534_t:CDS:2 [Dentiscutata erythropus]|uniref:12534_t:CDS:1 n=1 Tax=Dentiscutata erythropus TaxID=1348616 RepID=A0A9N9ERW9_9GLOM|nr:12534_t:CDS:2 [Dentiscutata erythropus]